MEPHGAGSCYDINDCTTQTPQNPHQAANRKTDDQKNQLGGDQAPSLGKQVKESVTTLLAIANDVTKIVA